MSSRPSHRTSRRWALVAAGLAISFVASFPRASQLPPGFVENRLVEGNILTGASKLTAIAYEPGTASLWMTEKGDGSAQGSARVRRLDADSGTVTTALDLECVDSVGERGLLSLAFHPRFADPAAGRRWVYLYYMRSVTEGGACDVPGFAAGPHATVSRFEEVGGALVNEQILLVSPHIPYPTNHNGGTLVFDRAESLFVSIGDHGGGLSSTIARDPGHLVGKILRLDEHGAPWPGNPYADVPGARPEVWAVGLRNPFRMSYDAESDTLLIADVGESNWEALYLGLPGADYGWPCVEGSHPLAECDPPPPTGSLTEPIFEYHHGNLTAPIRGAAVISGPVYHDGPFPESFHHRRFFADHEGKWIRHAAVEPNGTLSDVRDFTFESHLIVQLVPGPTGCLTWAAYFAGVFEICAVEGANTRPVAVAAGEPTAGLGPLTSDFLGSGSEDADGDPLAHAWDFGDGTTSFEPDPTHTFAFDGVYDVSLEVDDGTGTANATDRRELRVVVGNRRPRAMIDEPAERLRYDAGDTITFRGRGFDDDEGVLPPSAFRWTVTFHHDDHSHPFLGPISGVTEGSFDVPTDGERSANTWYRIQLDVEDSGVPLGPEAVLEAGAVREIFPNVSRWKLLADPPLWDLQLAIDAVAGRAPRQLDSVVGFSRTIDAPTPQTIGGAVLEFSSWSNGGPATQVLDTPPSDIVLTANYFCVSGCDMLVADADGDGASLQDGDCDDANGSVRAPPGEVTNLRFDSPDQLHWDPPATRGGHPLSVRYDVVRAPDVRQFARLGICAIADSPSTTAVDPETPAPGEAFFYLVGGVNNCPGVIADLGRDSLGRDRFGPDCR